MAKEYGMGNLSIVTLGKETSGMAAYATGRVTNAGATTRTVGPTDSNEESSHITSANISIRNADFDLSYICKYCDIAEDAIPVNKDDKGNTYFYIKLNIWGVSGDNFAKIVQAGDNVRVHGALKVNKYTGKDGQEHYSLEMTVYKWEKIFFRSNNATAKTEESAEAANVNEAVEESPVVNEAEPVVIEPEVQDIDFDALPY